MQLEVTEILKEALGKYRTARKAYVELGPASCTAKAHRLSHDYQSALEVLAYQVLLEAELQGIKV
ncbi:hypothetical protein FA378_27230 [Pseudomonas aeruginosa]|uniref:Uncharacterized protein n=1 Tax=Pseudomonas aeruginosa TaxID=287 RepID=A0A6B1YJ89_PSEAI|nr:hypothetical protein [Pseudomonas aeruginosa]MCO2278193.1 hypothetical protein [Pseudomonas aeruginosa]MCO2762371.1 hypothetical protein [Pseudomonas aeruginosa]MCO2768107.1 hypothetical protein [Pseudomonas aeruginosa]MZZ16606.1 hypothetical protein [Pseudomonas aeruginosa]HBN9243684.1 hypothetical protein [Pseudomonas aeruginosa]